MNVIAIDPGIVNIGITVGRYITATQMMIIHCNRVQYKNDKHFVEYLNQIILSNKLPHNLTKIVIERQPHNSSITNNMRYIQGYYTALGLKVVMKNSITYKLHINRYKDRKNYSIDLATSRLKDERLFIVNPEVVLNALKNDDRMHDICDSFNLLYDELCNQISAY